VHITDAPSFALVVLADPSVLIVALLVTREGKSFQRITAATPREPRCPIRIDAILRKVPRKVKLIFTYLLCNLPR
jgi:hypothetical protein